VGTRDTSQRINSWLIAASTIGMVAFGVIWEMRLRKVLETLQQRDDHASQWAERALHDPLTNLPNRTLLLDRIEQSLIRSRRNNSGVAVLFIDLDNFKQINDRYGHLVGDELLIAVGERFRQHLRGSDTAARLGGDEFVVLIEFGATDATNTVMIVAERLRSALQVPLVLEPEPLTVKASIGIAVATSGEEEPEFLLKEADRALLEAKHSGKNRVVRAPVAAETAIAAEQPH
jgi:diguanylate cyclase